MCQVVWLKGKLKHFSRNPILERISIAFSPVNSVIALIFCRSKRKPHLFWKICTAIAAERAAIQSGACYLSRASWRYRGHPRTSFVTSKGLFSALITSLLLVFLSLALSSPHSVTTGESTSKFLLALTALLLIRSKENLRSVIIKVSTLQLLLFVRIQGSLQLPFKDQDAAGCINVLPECAPRVCSLSVRFSNYLGRLWKSVDKWRNPLICCSPNGGQVWPHVLTTCEWYHWIVSTSMHDCRVHFCVS